MLSWYGDRCPTFDDLKRAAAAHGVQVAVHRDFDCPRLILDAQPKPEPWLIAIPSYSGRLAMMWALAHELGHLVLHDGPACREAYRMQEDEADAWASAALIPDALSKGLRKHVDAYTLFLWENYEQFPADFHGVHMLARRIGHARVQSRVNAA
jgi:hypothetical protein